MHKSVVLSASFLDYVTSNTHTFHYEQQKWQIVVLAQLVMITACLVTTLNDKARMVQSSLCHHVVSGRQAFINRNSPILHAFILMSSTICTCDTMRACVNCY